MGDYEDRVDKIAAESLLSIPPPQKVDEEIRELMDRMISLIHGAYLERYGGTR